jgi:hypothetical protein
MAIIYIDGPEKAGKSTVATVLKEEYGFRVRKWGPVDPDDRVYMQPLADDIASGDNVVWDRGWAAESVYASMLGRDRRLADDSWLGEWLYGRTVQTVGLRVMLLGPDVKTIYRLRDKDDLPVDTVWERKFFEDYGRRFGYNVWHNDHHPDAALAIARFAKDVAVGMGVRATKAGLRPPAYAGPPNARVVFVGQDRNSKSKFPGAWAPFTSRLTTMLGRELGDFALRCGWTNAGDCPPQAIRHAKLVVACGQVADAWVRNHVDHHNVITIKHPAYMYRWGKEKDGLGAYRVILNQIREVYDNDQASK